MVLSEEDLKQLEALAVLAKQYGMHHVRVGDIEFNLVVDPKPVDPKALAAALGATNDEDRCSCGHSLQDEHNPTGCLHGCSVELCAPQKDD